MPNAYKVAGQAAPLANTDTLLYTVPASTQFVKSSLNVCNRNTSAGASYRIAVVPAADTLATKHYLVYDRGISERATESRGLGITLAAGDKVYVRASTADLSFSLFGCEIT